MFRVRYAQQIEDDKKTQEVRLLCNRERFRRYQGCLVLPLIQFLWKFCSFPVLTFRSFLLFLIFAETVGRTDWRVDEAKASDYIYCARSASKRAGAQEPLGRKQRSKTGCIQALRFQVVTQRLVDDAWMICVDEVRFVLFCEYLLPSE